jgi:hypothetical protein
MGSRVERMGFAREDAAVVTARITRNRGTEYPQGDATVERKVVPSTTTYPRRTDSQSVKWMLCS